MGHCEPGRAPGKGRIGGRAAERRGRDRRACNQPTETTTSSRNKAPTRWGPFKGTPGRPVAQLGYEAKVRRRSGRSFPSA